MARKPRIHLSGGFYHIILRGNGGQDIFLADADRCRLLLLLQEGTCRFDYRVHAFCLMTNHLHLVLQAGNMPLSRGLQNLSFRYTRWVNQREKRTGHLFQGRYKAVLVDGESYLLELVRYIHLNPLRAGMVRSPDQYPWTSHLAYLGLDNLPWLTTDELLGQFGRQAGKARKAYARFLQDGLDEAYRKEFHCGGTDPRILGSDDFAATALAAEYMPPRDVSLQHVEATVLKVYGIDRAELQSPSQQRYLSEARAALAWLAREAGAGNLEQVSIRVNRDPGSLSSAVRRLSDRAKSDAALSAKLDTLMKMV
ncbi:transposase [Desulfobulbus alkaliphilus]|uniref:transposase n=1 Tax=Desulfobulbus alkaliphilus TaxID=869814 RepID=UPI001962BE10|nr:transposase [Desulfobulbus alkaliphilus]MBM9535607.1 transposase [Desulfobulbus alkaliphilus]